MASLTETPTWTPDIYQLEETDLVQGGPGGIDNLQAQALADRTTWLKERADEIDAAKAAFPSLQQRLDTADAVAGSASAITRVIAAGIYF